MQTSLFQKDIDLTEGAILKNNLDSPKERLLNKGADSLSNTELLSLVLAGNKNKTYPLAQKLLELANNSISSLARLGIKDLMRVEGLGEAQATTLVASFELSRRRNFEIASSQIIKKSSQAFDVLKPLIGDKNYEEFYILCINRANYLICYKKISEGGITGTVVDVRRIFKIALENNATSILLCHNHPSGNLYPSEADKIITRNVVEVGKVMDINVIDHLIVTSTSFYSFADEGLI